MAVLFALTPSPIFGQERAGDAEFGFLTYRLTNDGRQIANAYGLTLGFREFFPNIGTVTVNLAPAASNGRFRAGDSFVELKRCPWLGNYWTIRGGDFNLPGRIINVAFNNLYYPAITGRGASVEAIHGSRTIGFFFGAETLQSGWRVPLRLQAPQLMTGAYLHQQVGERLVIAIRFLNLSTDLKELRKSKEIAVTGAPLHDSRTAILSGLYTMSPQIKWYGEVAHSQSSQDQPPTALHAPPLSATFGPIIETRAFTLRANFILQAADYMPLLGYYLGDRRGPFAEIRVRPHSRFEVYGGASNYVNNVAGAPNLHTYRATNESAGASVRLPSRVSLSGQWSTMKVASKRSENTPWENAASKQIQISLSRTFGRHGIRLSAREIKQDSRLSSQRQRVAELADNFAFRWFSMGGEVRAQRSISDQSKMSLYVRGNGRLNFKGFSAYANIETGNDLANKTLFATSSIGTTVVGVSISTRDNWTFHIEAYRSRLLMQLNQQNIFILQNSGVFVPTILSDMNQWSIYGRMTKRLQWGKPIPQSISQSGAFAVGQTSLKGSIEGFVTSGERGPNHWAENIPVALDNGLIAMTDVNGHFRFESVAEGTHKVGIALETLPADFNPGPNPELAVVVRPGHPSRADLSVIPVGYAIHGTVTGPQDSQLESIVLTLLPTKAVTTPGKDGKFAFFNVPAGSYQVVLEQKSLPEFGILLTPAKLDVVAGQMDDSAQAVFRFDIQVPPKPVKRITLPSKLAPSAGPPKGQ